MVKGEQYWLVENGLNVISADVISVSGNLVLVKTQNGKTLRLPKHRLFESKEMAMGVLQKSNVTHRKSPYDYML